MGTLAVVMASTYLANGILYDVLPELWGQRRWFKIVSSIAAAAPYTLLAYLTASDMIRSINRKYLILALTFVTSVCAGMGASE